MPKHCSPLFTADDGAYHRSKQRTGNSGQNATKQHRVGPSPKAEPLTDVGFFVGDGANHRTGEHTDAGSQ